MGLRSESKAPQRTSTAQATGRIQKVDPRGIDIDLDIELDIDIDIDVNIT